MKKIAAILLISIQLFNLAGYKLFFEYLIQQNREEVVRILDNNEHNEAELIELKIPIHLPYAPNWQEYVRYDGEIELNGIHYNFARLKIAGDTLYLSCLPNRHSTELHKTLNSYAAQTSNNATSDSSGKTSPPQWKNIFEAEINDFRFYYTSLTISLDIKKYNDFFSALNPGFFTTPAQPPEPYS